MDIADAFQIVLELARDSAIDENDADCDEILADERKRQLQAINMIEDLAVNEFGDD